MMAMNAVLPRQRWSEVDGDVAHVLAVDDSFVDRKVIERLLKISSCKVTAVDSGRRALQFLGLDEEQKNAAAEEGLKIDLIITDYCMPGMTGYDLLKRIKESSAFREVPVVIMSSENVLARINRCLEEGAEEFLVKPVKLSDVKRLKDQLMAKEMPPRTEARDKTVISNKRKLSDGPDLSTSPTSSESQSQSPPSIASPRSSPSQSPDFTPSPPPSLRSSPSPPPLSSPGRRPAPSTELDEIIGESPL